MCTLGLDPERHLVREHGVIDDLWVDPPRLHGMITAPERPDTGSNSRKSAEVQDLAGTVFGQTLWFVRTSNAGEPPCQSSAMTSNLPSSSPTTASSRTTDAVLVYKAAVDLEHGHPEKTIEGLFAPMAGAYVAQRRLRFSHYHATVHEALGIARVMRGCASAVTAVRRSRSERRHRHPARRHRHQCLSASADFSVVGAYPRSEMQVTRPTPKITHTR